MNYVTIYDRTKDEVYEKEDAKAIKYVMAIKEKDGKLFKKAHELISFLGLAGLWKGYYIAMEEVLKSLIDERIETHLNIEKEVVK